MQYKRVLLKLSGELLKSNKSKKNIDHAQLQHYAEEIIKAHKLGIGITIVIGGGNIHRGNKDVLQLNRTESDHIGMLATIMNGIALRSYLENNGVPTMHMSSIACAMCDVYKQQEAIKALEHGHVVVLTGGLGLPYFTTDTAASLRAIELGAEVMLKMTNVDGIYSADPNIDPYAVKFDHLTFQDAIDKKLAVLDRMAFVLCQTYKLPLIVFDAAIPNALLRIIKGEHIGTIVSDHKEPNIYP
ncbi:Uridylate kinase [Cardinium endosymbiont of Culicoides punctatus]|nr:Uridylate kinase [Cardinium endosymbiont of Culicoides punctatus]